MIYVLTVHWKSDFWVDAQISRLRKHLRDPFRIFAFCDQMQRDHSGKFDYCSPVKGIVDHASKLNLLAEVVCREASEDDVLVFCEIRTRRSAGQGGALESVTPAKQRQVVRVARHFLARHPRWHAHPMRFDVVAIDMRDARATVTHVRDAFDADA